MPKNWIGKKLRQFATRAAQSADKGQLISARRDRKASKPFDFEALPLDLKILIAEHMAADVLAKGGTLEIGDIQNFLAASKETRLLGRVAPLLGSLVRPVYRLGETLNLAGRVHATAVLAGKQREPETVTASRTETLKRNNVVAAAPTFGTLPPESRSQFIKGVLEQTDTKSKIGCIEEISRNADYLDHMKETEIKSVLKSALSIYSQSCKEIKISGGKSDENTDLDSIARSIYLLKRNLPSYEGKNSKKLSPAYAGDPGDGDPRFFSIAERLADRHHQTRGKIEPPDALERQLKALAETHPSTEDDRDGLSRAERIHEIGFKTAANLALQRREARQALARTRERSTSVAD